MSKLSKRQEIRQKRLHQQKKQRYIFIGIISVFALLVAALLIAPNFKSVGSIVEITPAARPQVVDNTMGDPNAPVKVEEYADFQCPACMRFATNFEPQIIQQYVTPGKVYYVFNSFSFIGQESVDAAQAAYCAMDQGKFWEYHDILFANQNGENIGDFTIPRLKAFAKTLGLDTNTFNTCLDSGAKKRKVDDDRTSGSGLGVNATPSFIVNGTLVHSDTLIQTIEEELAKK